MSKTKNNEQSRNRREFLRCLTIAFIGGFITQASCESKRNSQLKGYPPSTSANQREGEIAQQPKTCPTCRGTGKVICPVCKGSGKNPYYNEAMRYYGQSDECPECKFSPPSVGRGYVICPTCYGNRVIYPETPAIRDADKRIKEEACRKEQQIYEECKRTTSSGCPLPRDCH